MNYEIKEYNELSDLFNKFQIVETTGLLFIPENIDNAENSKDFIYSETTTDLRKVFEGKQQIDYLTKDKPLLRARKSADWFGPTILIGATILTENPHLIGITFNILSSYLYDIFKGTTKDKKVKFDIVLEDKKKKQFQKINYEGNVEGIAELEKVINKLKK
ncbi:hypothetical protein GUB10_00020 [Salegentibacter sp. BLCTC]|uniref:hypothetical protein n=1 Tax=Salegentibacter sp. BLCTC TaxID=2697368 RepID=UPI00187B625B|nr:hypothetical protein [Salegentibacter sp. BLCTC]MBE7638705.1 hypothetical protein [Salegentibacter sp. BLCTC]